MDIQDPVTLKSSNTDGLSPVLTEEHTAAIDDRPKRLRTQTREVLGMIRMSQLKEERGGDEMTSSCLLIFDELLFAPEEFVPVALVPSFSY